MTPEMREAFIAGTKWMTFWTDLLDRINVFPLPDDDTGQNMKASLACLCRMNASLPEEAIQQLAADARGNSGNIAARFFSGFLTAETPDDLARAACLGKNRAWSAMRTPRPGTMLTVLDALSDTLEAEPALTPGHIPSVINRLEAAVRSTTDMLPELKLAGVVDAGALAMFIYLEGFFRQMAGNQALVSVTRRFAGQLGVTSGFQGKNDGGYCITQTCVGDADTEKAVQQLAGYVDDMVADPDMNICPHAPARWRSANSPETLESWWDEDVEPHPLMHTPEVIKKRPVHIMTDAAASLTREDARQRGITLLDSYITAADMSLPESLITPSELYRIMRSGGKVSTSQTSAFERHQQYRTVLSLHEQVLYLCTGSVYTGNYDTAAAWQAANDPDSRFIVMDTGTASGHLGLVVMATAEYADRAEYAESVVRFARAALARCGEYIFPDRLHYMAAGRRISRAGAFFGDMIHLKPVIQPGAEGNKKVGMVRDQEAQVRFAFEKLDTALPKHEKAFILLEYSDNREWVENSLFPEVQQHFPMARVITGPLSLTSGAHMGPGTWAVAFLSECKKNQAGIPESSFTI